MVVTGSRADTVITSVQVSDGVRLGGIFVDILRRLKSLVIGVTRLACNDGETNTQYTLSFLLKYVPT